MFSAALQVTRRPLFPILFATFSLFVGSILAARIGWAADAPGIEKTALDFYTAAPDPNYGYKLAKTMEGPGYTAYVLDVTSQSWRSSDEVNRTIWRHWLTILKPDDVRTDIGLLFITGGANGSSPPDKVDNMFAKIALGTHSVLSVLQMVPNQPLLFADERDPRYKEKGRVEDALIAFTWDKFLKTGDELWPAQLPMAKSAVKAMDTITAFCAGEKGGKIDVTRFVVAGGSKRGWTTWLTAAVDSRVVGICPIVIDMLNLEESFKHHWQAYGFWAPAVQDYVDMKIMERMGTPEFHKLLKLVEPFEYRSRYAMPKFILNSAGDQFFLPDSSQFYFDDLPGVKYLRYVPNSDHGLDGTDAAESLAAFHYAIINKVPLPKFSWEFPDENTIQVKTTDQPAAVKLWQATNPEARDFRQATIGNAYKSTDLKPQGADSYLGKVETPEKGWTAFFVELTFPSGAQVPFKFTTPVRVVPDKLPFDPPQPSG